MENTIKTTRILTVFFSVLIIAALIIGRDAHAGGGVNHKVTVQNPTEYRIIVWVSIRQADLVERIGDGVIIGPGGSHTWETGAKCPADIEGQISVNDKWLKMKSMDCLGNDHNYDANAWTTCCWDISASACQKTGQGYTEVRDLDYGFCKN